MHRPRFAFTAALAALAIVVGFGAGHARADTVEIPAAADGTLYQDAEGDLANGAGEYLFAGNTGQPSFLNSRRGLIRFDVAAAVPPGSTVTAVTLELYVSRVASPQPRTISLHRVLQAWGEGASQAIGGEGVGGPAEADDATWLYRFFDPADPPSSPAWDTIGGDFDPAASAATDVGGQNAFITWTGTTGIVADVQGWLDDPATNHGWLLLGDESELTTAKRFNSRQYGGQSVRRPTLTVEFTAAAPSGACCLPGGDCVPAADEAECTALGGTFQGLGTECGSVACPQPIGACCLPVGGCVELTEAECLALEGTYLGEGSSCADDPCPLFLEPFVDELPIPPTAVPSRGVPGGAATYDIAMRETVQQLHRDLPPTVVWGYDDGVNGPVYPGPSIIAMSGETVTVNWSNDLRYVSGPQQGQFREEHFLPVDECLHGPAHAGPTARTVVHLHGAHVQARYDGYPEHTWLPGESETYVYENLQPGGTLWYHDHALGITRLNVMMGLAGAYVLRDQVELDLVASGQLPGGAFDVPLILQDRSLASDGRIVYPADWQDHFFGQFPVVNGVVAPFMTVPRGIHRFRLVGGTNSRQYDLALSDGTGFTVIGTDGGLLETPVAVTEVSVAPGERVDVLVDFSDKPDGTEIILANTNVPNMPGAPQIPQVMKFIVQGGGGFTGVIPGTLRVNEVLMEADASISRDFLLRREPASSPDCADPWWLINGLGWDDITERPELGATEIWRFVNPSGQTHPMHMHLLSFQVLDHTPVSVGADGTVTPIGPPVGPGPTEGGWKDTVQVRPGTATRVIARFEDYVGTFAYHCHILEHEDHEMMRQFQTVLPCASDADRDGTVGFDDVLVVLSDFGGCPEPCSTLGEIQDPDTCMGDVDRNCLVDFSDLLAVLGGWGPCDG